MTTFILFRITSLSGSLTGNDLVLRGYPLDGWVLEPTTWTGTIADRRSNDSWSVTRRLSFEWSEPIDRRTSASRTTVKSSATTGSWNVKIVGKPLILILLSFLYALTYLIIRSHTWSSSNLLPWEFLW